MPKIRSVVVWTIAALVTAGVEIVGLHRAIALRNQLDSEPSCPAPAAMLAAPVAPAIHAPPRPDVQIRVLSVRDDAVEIEAGGKRHELPGYPPPRSKDHKPGRLTTAVVSPDGKLVAVAGECPGTSGVTVPRAPSCVPVFVRLYGVGDGAPAGDLKMLWDGDNDRRRALAMVFDQRAERLAVLVRTSWSDCMWDGDNVELFVYRLADGARIARRLIATRDTGATHSLVFDEDEVHLLTTSAHAYPKTRVVRLRKQGPA
jgi:hypothetical protein